MENTNQENFDINDIKDIKISWNPSLEEKIDYIYKSLKAQKRNAYIKAFLKVLVFWLLVFFLFYFLPNLPQEKKDFYTEKFTNIVSERLSEFITPIVKDVTWDVVKDMEILPEQTSTWKLKNVDVQELQRKLEIIKKMHNK